MKGEAPIALPAHTRPRATHNFEHQEHVCLQKQRVLFPIQRFLNGGLWTWGLMKKLRKIRRKKNKNPFFSPQIEVLRQITSKICLLDVFPS